MRITLLVVLLLSTAGSTLAQDLWLRRAPLQNETYFEAVVAVGDIDGDGCSELVKPIWYAPTLPAPQPPLDILKVFSGRDHSVIATIKSNSDDAGLAYAIGDIDRDGSSDFALSRRSGYKLRLEVYSGRLLRRMFAVTHADPNFESRFWSVGNAGDVNADLTDDILLGAPGMNGLYGGCLVISGKDGSLIHNVPVPTPPAWYRPYSFGSAVSAAGDVNQDGHADFYVSDSEWGYNSDPYGVVGSVFLFSGKDASLLGHWNGKWRSWFGRSLLLGPDLDKDGVRELLVGAPGYYSTTLGVIHCLNPRNPQKVNIYNPPSSGYVGYGSCLATMGDYDKDGVPDFYTVAGVQSAYALLGISGASGKVLWEYQDTRPVKDHYVGFFSSGDINGDGPLDLVIGYSPNGWTSPNQIPYYDIWCDSLVLRSNERQLSLSGNDTQYFELDAGPAHANAPYLLLGSLSGIAPGLPLGRCTLPLNPDPYLLFSITAPNTTLLPGGLGVLDAQGKASARFVAIPGPAPELRRHPHRPRLRHLRQPGPRLLQQLDPAGVREMSQSLRARSKDPRHIDEASELSLQTGTLGRVGGAALTGRDVHDLTITNCQFGSVGLAWTVLPPLFQTAGSSLLYFAQAGDITVQHNSMLPGGSWTNANAAINTGPGMTGTWTIIPNTGF
jgi:hypothetical protein